MEKDRERELGVWSLQGPLSHGVRQIARPGSRVVVLSHLQECEPTNTPGLEVRRKDDMAMGLQLNQ